MKNNSVNLRDKVVYRSLSSCTGLTLIEILVVIIISVVLATIVISNFNSRKEQAFDKEATISLGQMSAAEKLCYVERDAYYPGAGNESNINNINDNLKLDLVEDNWDYKCDSTGCVQATRIGGVLRNWRLRINEGDPVSGTCP